LNLQDITNFLNDVAKAFAALHSELTVDSVPEVTEDLAAQILANPSIANEIVAIDLYDIDISEAPDGVEFDYEEHTPNEVKRLVSVIIGSAGFVADMYVAEPAPETESGEALSSGESEPAESDDTADADSADSEADSESDAEDETAS